MSESHAGNHEQSFPPPDWNRWKPLVDAVLDSAPSERAMVLTALAEGDPARRAELERLVAECERDMPLLNRPAAERFAGLLAAPEDVPLPEILGGRYRITREIGHGGMARVYLAFDVKHSRNVAVKVIRADLAASLGRERFLREIGIAARLRHPNIVPLYDSGDADGVLYFVMPYEDGPSLRARLADGEPIAVPDCLNVLRDVARALSYAHDHGVVHRDVKPDNVLLSGGAAVVTDFGIAKAVSVAQTGDQQSTLTQLGTGIGTPAYMSPEQAVGDPSTDHRADIYSFGCLAFELFAGVPPFHGLAAHEIITAHVTRVPPLVSAHRGDVPPAVAMLIGQCLEKSPSARPQNARDVLHALDGAATAPPPAVTRAETPPRRLRVARWTGVALAAMVVASAAWIALGRATTPVAITMSVLPFGNTGADSAFDFVANGLAEEVASALARSPGIRIKSRTGARAYKGAAVDVAAAGLRLKAEYILQGDVRQQGGRWILSADLERASDATAIWDTAFNVSRDQQSGAAEVIATSVVAGLRKQFPRSIGTTPVLGVHQRTANPEAYRLYLRGQEGIDRRKLSVRESATLFRAAIHEDSLYARAHAGLSMALALFPYFEEVPVDSVRGDLIVAARRALDLDETLALPHVALGLLQWFSYQWDSAETEFQTALRLDSHNVEAHIQYARFLDTGGRLEDALRQLRLARDDDPVSAVVHAIMANAYYYEGRLDSALAESRRSLQNDSTNYPSLGIGAAIHLANGLPKEARALANRARRFPLSMYVIAKTGDTAAVRQWLRELDARTPQPPGSETRRAFAYLGLGDTARALTALERATDAREIWHASNGLSDPAFASVRRSARFRILLRRVGLAR